MKKLLFGAAVFAGACGLSEDKFNDDFASTLCAKSNECLSAEGLDEIDCNATVEDADAVTDIVCDYDSSKASECLDELDAASCDGAILSTPTSCGQVFTNCTGGE
jgi:hypothetical protein